MLKYASLAGLMAAALTLPSFASAEPMEIVFAISTPQGAMGQVTGQRFTDLCNQKLAGKAKIAYYHSDQMGPDKDLMQKLKLGTIHLTYMASEMPQYVEESAIFDMPFVVKDRDHVLAIEKSFVRTVFADAAKKKGYKYIALWENGFRHITNSVRPIVTPKDLEGIKIRVPRSKWRVEMFKMWGANPTPMPFSEVFVGLQTGALDGQENPLTHISANKLEEVQKYLTIANHVYSPNFVLAFEKHWEKVPADIRKVLEDTAEDVRPWSYDEVAKADDRLVGELAKRGMKVNEVDRAAFVTASKPIYAKFEEDVKGGSKMIEDILKLAK